VKDHKAGKGKGKGKTEDKKEGKDKGKGRKEDKKAGKDKKKGKETAQSKELPPDPPWKPGATPFVGFLRLAREMPDFGSFASGTDEIELSVVVHDGTGLSFLDECKAKAAKTGWQVEGCRAVRLKSGGFLSRLVAAGTDTSGAPGSLSGLKSLLDVLRKARKAEDIEKGYLEAARENPKAYSITHDVEADIKQCGAKRYFASLATVPVPQYVGPSAVVIDLGYGAQAKGRQFRLKASMARTREGWRLGGLRVWCL